MALTEFQVEVCRLFFALPAADGYLLAGGAALAAQHLTTRPTRDLDFFVAPGTGDIATARDAFEIAVIERGWQVSRIRDEVTFCRLVVHGPEDLLVDLALDSRPGRRPVMSVAGPTFDPAELAGRKVVALFDRAAARDFTDVHALTAQFEPSRLLQLAREVDAGFDDGVFSQMLGTLDRFTDDELPVAASQVPGVRQFFADWRRKLGQGHGPEGS